MKNSIKFKKLAVQLVSYNRQKQTGLVFLNSRLISKNRDKVKQLTPSSKLKKKSNISLFRIATKFSTQNTQSFFYKFKSLLYAKWSYSSISSFFVTSKSFITALNKVLYCLKSVKLQGQVKENFEGVLRLSYVFILRFLKGGALCFYNGMRGTLPLKRYLVFLYWMFPLVFSRYNLYVFHAFQRLSQNGLIFFKVPCVGMKLVIRSKKKRKCFVKKSLKRRRFLKKKRNRKKRWKLFFLTPLLSTYGDSLYLVLFIKKTCKKNEEIKRILKSFWDFYRNLVRIKTNSPNNFEVFRRYIGLLKLFLTIKENYYENEKFVDNFWSFYKDKEKYQSKARPKFP